VACRTELVGADLGVEISEECEPGVLWAEVFESRGQVLPEFGDVLGCVIDRMGRGVDGEDEGVDVREICANDARADEPGRDNERVLRVARRTRCGGAGMVLLGLVLLAAWGEGGGCGSCPGSGVALLVVRCVIGDA